MNSSDPVMGPKLDRIPAEGVLVRVSGRHHIHEKHGGPKSIELKQIGPRFELRLYQIKLGTMDQTEAQVGNNGSDYT